VNNYYNKMKALSDTLTSIGQPLRSDEFTSFVLSGLDEDYDNLVEMAQWHGTTIPAHDLLSRMLSTEQRIKALHSSAMIHFANTARYGKSVPCSSAPAGQSRPNINNGTSYSAPRPTHSLFPQEAARALPILVDLISIIVPALALGIFANCVRRLVTWPLVASKGSIKNFLVLVMTAGFLSVS
jgi:hypothetical protein